METFNIYKTISIPPIIAFGAKEKEETKINSLGVTYDYVSQTTPFPLFCVDKGEVSFCAKLKKRHLFQPNEYVDVCDDCRLIE